MTAEITDMDKFLLDDFEKKLSAFVERHISRIGNVQNGGKPPEQYNATGETIIILSAVCAVLARRVLEKGGRPDETTALLFVLEGMLFFSRDRMQALADQLRQQPQKPTILRPGE